MKVSKYIYYRMLPRVAVRNRLAVCLSVARLSWAFVFGGVVVVVVVDRARRIRHHRFRRHRRLGVGTRPPNH